MNRSIAAVAIVCFLFVQQTQGGDWPQFLGPSRDGVYAGSDIARSWPKDGPPVVWKAKVGQGFSGPVCANGQLIVFHRLNDEEVVECRDALTGTTSWRFAYATHYRDDFGFDEGPRATPAILDGKVYTHGAEGTVHCLDLKDGRKLWSVDAKQMFRTRKGFFGMACSPLVEGDHVLLNIGGTDGAGIIALHKRTGELVWKATNHEASYSSPTAATIGGQRLALFFTREGVVAIEPRKGAVLWEYPWRAQMHASVNAATPLVVQDLVFVSASYDVGAVVLQASNGRSKKIWASDEALSNHYANSVHRDGYLYGLHGRQETGPSLRCVELKSGQVRWSNERYPAGTVTLAGDKLFFLLEDGRLLMVPAIPDRFQVSAEAQVLPSGVRAYPALADGHLYARSRDQLVCVKLRDF